MGSVYGYIFLLTIIFSIWATYSSIKRIKKKIGCFIGGYIFLVIFSVTLFSIGITVALGTYVYGKMSIMIGGDKYASTIVDYETTYGTDDEGNTTSSTYPVVSFVTTAGDSVTTTSTETILSHELPEIGSEYTIYYNPSNGRNTSVGAMTYIAFFGMIFMALFLFGALTFIVKFALGHNNIGDFIASVRKFAAYIFAPVAMIAFDGLLIYGLLYGNTEAGWVKGMLIFFIIMLTLGTIGYIKLLFKNSAEGRGWY